MARHKCGLCRQKEEIMAANATKRASTAKSMAYADFGTRLVAAIIDGLILMGVGIAARAVGMGFIYRRIDIFVGAAYAIFFWVNRGGATLGKQVMKIKVVTEDGKPVDYKTAVLRYLGYIVSSIVIFLGFLWVLWDEKKQGWHDKIAKTVVVKS